MSVHDTTNLGQLLLRPSDGAAEELRFGIAVCETIIMCVSLLLVPLLSE